MSSRSTSTPTAPAASNTTMNSTMVPHDKIAMRAYDKWCKRGCPAGTDKQDWLEAEAELRAEMNRMGTGTTTRR
jgi:hypothetical protein